MDFEKAYLTEAFRISHTVTRHPDPNSFKMHTHQLCEFYYFISGSAVFHIEGTDYVLNPGDILIMDNAESHYIEPDCHFTYERLVINFSKDFIKSIDPDGKLLEPFEKRPHGRYNLFRKENFENKLYLMLINNIITSKNQIQTTTNFFALLNELSTSFLKEKSNKAPANDTVVNQIVDYINDNLDKQIRLEDICNEFFLSKSYLCRMFKKSMGSTIWNYITVKRLNLAKGMIESGILPTQVYFKCGFSDYSVFYRAYKNHFGSSPKNTQNKD